MRIALCGTANQNIVEFANDFLKEFPMYKRNENHFNTILEQKNINTANQVSQSIILNSLLDDTLKYDKDQNILFEYSLIDNLVCSMWLNTQNLVSDGFIKKSMVLIKQAIHFYDIILYFPNIEKYTPKQTVVENTEDEQTKQLYYVESGNFYTGIHDLYLAGNEQLFDFRSVDGCPGMVEIFGNSQERIQMVKLYLDSTGQPLGKNVTDSLITLPTLEEQNEIDKLRALTNK
jgi:hypothetical protein